MGSTSSIFINGRHYDTATGMPLADGAPSTKVAVSDHSSSHTVSVARGTAHHHASKPQRSRTLRRDIVAKPHGAYDHAAAHTPHHAHVAKSPLVHKFAPHPVASKPTPTSHDGVSHIVAATHRAHAAEQAKPVVARSSRELKDHLIATKLAEAQPNTHRPPKKSRLRTPARVSSVMAASFAIMLLGGYLSYINMPHLSVRVAAAQAGVSASYPGYTPSGYRFDGPVAYTDGQVSLAFAANGGTTGYRIVEKKTTWDSQAVLDNYVTTKAQDYAITASSGMTIYTFAGNAAWVNNGTLYTISGDAPLSTPQIVHIAESL